MKKKYNHLDKISKFFMCFVFCVLFTQMKASATENIQIHKDYMMSEKPIQVENPQGYSLRWYVDDKFVSESTYTPTAADYEKWITVKAYSDGEFVSEDRIYFSKLPVVYINTEDGAPITSRDTYKSAAMDIQNNEECNGSMYSGSIQIKGRGNQSWMWKKKPYKIKLSTSTNLFGFGKNKHWVLIANYRDESLIRNTIANSVSVKLGLTGMDTTWVDVILNGEYVGNYQFCEHVRVDETRLNIYDWSKDAEVIAKAVYNVEKSNGMTKNDRDEIEGMLSEHLSWITSGEFTYQGKAFKIADYLDYQADITGGYLFELNKYVENIDGKTDISEFNNATGMRIVVDTPEYAVTNDDMMDYVKKYWQSFEDAYCSLDGYNSDGLHYTELADFDSMVNYWITNEMLGNYDAYGRSRWVSKDIEGLLKFGPVWDFDYGFGVKEAPATANAWSFSTLDFTDNLFKYWIDDPYFVLKAEETYWDIRPYMQSLVEDGGLIDQYNDYLKESGAANQAIWKYSIGYQEDTDNSKQFLKERLAWLDSQFATQESIMKSLYTTNSDHAYTKSDDKIKITLTNAVEDTLSEHAPADGRIGANQDAKVNVVVMDKATVKLAVYVNGLKYNTYHLAYPESNVTINASAFTEEKGTKNIISFIGYDSENNVTLTNFASLIVTEDETAGTGSPTVTPPVTATIPTTVTAKPTPEATETPTPIEGSGVTPTSVVKSTVTPTAIAVPTVKVTVAPTKAAVASNVKTATPSPVSVKTKISKATVSKIATQYYFGKALKPTVVVKYKGKVLTKGKDYTVSYKNNKKVGTAKVTMKGVGKYTGTKVITFKIVNGYQNYKVVAKTKLYKSTSTTSKQLAVLKKGKSVKAYANDTKKDKKGRVWKKVKVGSKTGYVRAIKLKKK